MIDVDRFKRFNESYRHDAGDVVLPDTNLESTTSRAQRILEFVRGLEITHNGKTLRPITASLGLAMNPQSGETVSNAAGCRRTRRIGRTVDCVRPGFRSASVRGRCDS